MEMRGTARSLGALDLNANYFKSMRVLDPNLLSPRQIASIKAAFRPLKSREVENINDEVSKSDRINFDRVVLRSFGIDDTILPSLYKVLISAVNDRVSMKNR